MECQHLSGFSKFGLEFCSAKHWNREHFCIDYFQYFSKPCKKLWTQLLLSSLDFWSNDGFPIMCPSNYWFCHALHLKRTHCILHISNKFQFGRVLWKRLERSMFRRLKISMNGLILHFDSLYQCIILTVNKRYLAKAIHEHEQWTWTWLPWQYEVTDIGAW